MSYPSELAWCARDVTRFPGYQGVASRAIVRFFDGTGLWRYPARASGDLEEMSFLDKVYWLYKAGRPVRHAARGSGLERFFATQPAWRWDAPEGFAVTAGLRLSAAGDLMNHAYLARSGESLFREVADVVFGVDVAMANLECIPLDSPAGAFEIDGRSSAKLYLEPDAFRAVTGGDAGKFAFLATACNHSLDFGEEGIASTIRTLRDHGIAYHGVNEREEDADRATIVERNGIRLGLIAHSFGLNAIRPPAHRPRIVNRMRLNDRPERIDFTPIEAQLRHCEREGVDFVVAQLHWGMEHELYPRPEQIDVAHHLAEMGVDAIVGHHPHVLQPVEHYRTRCDPARVVPVYYSLGNLTNPFAAPYLCRSGVARLELVKGTCADGSTRTYVRHAALREVEQVADGARKQLSLRAVPSSVEG